MAPDLSQAGRIVGRALVNGTVEQQVVVLDMDADPACARMQRWEQHAVPRVQLNDDSTLRDVLVYVSDGLDGLAFPDPTPEDAPFGFNVPDVLEHVDCIFRPSVLALRTGQTLTLRNSDDTLHTLSARLADGSSLDVSQPRPGSEHQHTFARAEVGIPIRCKVHPWMTATIHVFDHPYFSVADEDFGIDLGPIPPGYYTVVARHEILGSLSQKVTVAPNETVEIAFTFEP
jgi:plastocyanin